MHVGKYIKVESKGSFSHMESFLKKMHMKKHLANLDKYGQQGVEALSHATPVDSGHTASSWGYEIEKNDDNITLHWTNSNINDGVNIAVILQYGHGTGTGGYVQGRDYINPAMRPIFDKIANDAWLEVTRA